MTARRFERIGPPMAAHEVLALRAAVNVLKRYSFPGVVEVMETVLRDEEHKRARMRSAK